MAYKRISPQPIIEGGTGASTLTSNGVLLGNGTSAITATTAGTTGQVLTGVTGSAPTFQSPAASSISITGDTGGALTGNAFTFTGGTTGLSFGGSGTTETVSGTLIVGNGGTGQSTLTNHGVLIGAGTSGITQLGVALSGTGLMGNTGADPSFTGSPSYSGTVTAGTGVITTNGDVQINNTASNATSPTVVFQKSRSGGVITVGDVIGLTNYYGHDGTGFIRGALIRAVTTGTIATNRIPAQLEFWTHPDSTSGVAQRMTIASTGTVTIATPDSGTGLTVSGGGITATAGAITATSGDVVITAGNLTLPTTSSTVGQIKQGATAIFHTYGTGNTFTGGAGNFTLTTGSATFNTATGSTAMASLTTGSQNMAYGVGAGNKCDTGSLNAFIGVNAGQNIAGGSENTVIGQASLSSLTTGNYNTVIGRSSGNSYTGSESSNILIGRIVAGTAAESNTLRIGAGTGTGNGQLAAAFIQGIAGVTVSSSATVLINTSTGQLGTVASSERYKENIQDITQSNIMQLRPVSFNFKTDDTKATNYGFIAEEVAEHMPELVVYNTKGEPETVQYHQMYALLLKEIQNLKKEVEELKTQRNMNE